ncbi:MAG: lactate utilization protein C [Candidatus Bipolaricaulia bacterium]
MADLPAGRTVQRFKEKYESLAGKVHLAADAIEVVELVSQILQEADATCVALADLPEELQRAIAQHCVEAGIQVVQPPFDGASLPQALDAVQVGVNTAAFGIADTGTLVEVATDDAFRLVSTLPRVHVSVIRTEDLVATLEDVAPRLREIYERQPRNCTVIFISGPSRTGDIEMQLVLGVHGPEQTHAVVLQETEQ